jgi:hypothetical protein
MNRLEILTGVKNYTLIDDTEMETLVYAQLDNVQDNMICNNIHGHDFSWLKKYYEINTIPTHILGHVSVVQDSTTVTGDVSALFTAAMVGRVIKFEDDEEYYLITAYVSATEVTLQTAYIGTTIVLGHYTIYTANYSLPSDFKRMEYVKQVAYEGVIPKMNDRNFSSLYPDEFQYTGEITGYIESGMDTSSNRMIRFYPIQTTRKRIYFGYIKKLPTINTVGATSAVPDRYHQLFVFKLGEIVYRMNDMESKAQTAKADFDDLLYKAVAEDRNAFADEKDVMSEEIIFRETNYHRVNLPTEV